MFGDVGHGVVLALGGLAIWRAGHQAQTRDSGLLLMFGGGSSMIFGALYGSYFGLPQFKPYALWHDPLEGNPLGLMFAAVAIGIGMISLGLVLNVVNHLRRGDVIGGLFDKFGVAGAVFYWGALALVAKFAALQSAGLLRVAILLFLVLPVAGWMLKDPLKRMLRRRAGQATEADGGGLTKVIESLVEVFEAVLSYFANTVSFVRIAAYAMSHAALLGAAFMIAAYVSHLSPGGNLLSVLVIILGNLVALVLEGVIASVQALRLEYYEFFGKFFSASGQPFKPFCLPTTTVAEVPH
jgi:V/A-type H+/Na+-transporting ATPase subunit I